MFDDLDDVKEFMQWCSKMGVSRAKLGDVEFEIFPAKLASDFVESRENTVIPEPTGNRSNNDDEEALFWSSGG